MDILIIAIIGKFFFGKKKKISISIYLQNLLIYVTKLNKIKTVKTSWLNRSNLVKNSMPNHMIKFGLLRYNIIYIKWQDKICS